MMRRRSSLNVKIRNIDLNLKSMHLLWFRRDLRLTDNEIVTLASTDNAAVLPFFIIDPWFYTWEDVGSSSKPRLSLGFKQLSTSIRSPPGVVWRILYLSTPPILDWSQTRKVNGKIVADLRKQVRARLVDRGDGSKMAKNFTRSDSRW